MSTARKVMDSSGSRRADLAAIHIAKAALGWDDEMYRDIMFTVCRERSAGLLDHAGRKRLLAHLQACQRQHAGTKAPRKREEWTPSAKLIWALWQQLADQGRVNERKRPALDAWIKRTTGVDRLEWLTDKQVDQVIESLKRWRDRKDTTA